MIDESVALRDSARRWFLARAGIIGAAVVLPGVALVPPVRAGRTREPHEPVSAETRYGLLVDSTKCARDCDACVRACDDEHGLEPVNGPATDPR